MNLYLTDYKKVLNKDSEVKISIDGIEYEAIFKSYNFTEGMCPAKNGFTGQIDDRYTSTTELKFTLTKE